MDITNIINDFSCGVFYTKNSILYYVNKQGTYKNIKFSEVGYELLNRLSLDIIRKETKFKSFNYIYILMSIIIMFSICFGVNAYVLSNKGLSFDKYFKMNILNERFLNKEIEETRLLLIKDLKSDYPNISINEKDINVIEVDNLDNIYGAVYLTDIFSNKVILVYDNVIDYNAHEIIHHLSNHGFYTGWRNSFSNNYRAINEGMTEYIKNKYLPETKVLYQEQHYIESLISIFGEEDIIRSFFDNSNEKINKLIATYSGDYNLLEVIDADHLKYNNVSQIEEYIVQTFLNYLQKNQYEIVDFDLYVNNFVSVMIKKYDKDSIETKNIYDRIIRGVLAINDKYLPENLLVQY